MKTKQINNRGITLIEVVISLAILAFGILSLMLLYTSGIRSTVKAQSLTQKTSQATAQIEEIMATPYEKLKDGCKETTIKSTTIKTCWHVIKDKTIKNTKKIYICSGYKKGKKDKICTDYKTYTPDGSTKKNPNETVYEYTKPYHK